MTKPTHTGWFLFCPVYLADLDTDCPWVDVRWAPEWWLHANISLANAVIGTAGVLGLYLQYPLIVTGELNGAPT